MARQQRRRQVITFKVPTQAAPSPAPAASSSSLAPPTELQLATRVPKMAPAAAPVASATTPSAALPADDLPRVAGDDERVDPPARPATPGDYRAELPADFKPPDGVNLTSIDANDPRVALARDFAHKEGLSQEQFSRMLGLYAHSVTAELQAYNRAIEAEGKKLGPQAAARGQRVKAWLTERLGAEAAAALTSRFTRGSDVEAFEGLAGIDTRAPLEHRLYPNLPRRS